MSAFWESEFPCATEVVSGNCRDNTNPPASELIEAQRKDRYHMASVFEVAVVQNPTTIEAQAGGQAVLVLDYTTVVASTPHAALLKLGAQKADVLNKAAAHSDQWEVKIRNS